MPWGVAQRGEAEGPPDPLQVGWWGCLGGREDPPLRLSTLGLEFWNLLSGGEVGSCCRTLNPLSLSLFLLRPSQTVLRIVVLGIWDYIENKIEVNTGATPSPSPGAPPHP